MWYFIYLWPVISAFFSTQEIQSRSLKKGGIGTVHLETQFSSAFHDLQTRSEYTHDGDTS